MVFNAREAFNETLRLLNVVNRTISEARNNELKPLGITTQQSAMLHRVKSLGDNATVTNIAQRLSRDVSSVSDMLVRLEKRGLVRRFIYPNDRRQVYVFLTEKGQKLREGTRLERGIISHIGSRLGERRIRELNTLLAELYDISRQENQHVLAPEA